MMLKVVLWTSLALGPSYSFAQEYFGEFKDPLKGQFVDATPRPKFKIETQFRFADPNGLIWETPAGTEVDGASIPQAFWSLIGGPFEGDYIKASVIHDYYCRAKSRTAHDTHRNFYYGMRANGVDIWKSKLMYWVVDTFGPKWELAKRVVQELRCTEDTGWFNCKQVPVERVVPVLVSTVDLSDPDTFAAAMSKASAVARTLRTSDGKILDLSAGGEIRADLAEISKNANQYRVLFSTRDYQVSPSKLGVLSQWDAVGLEQVKPWKNDKLPKFSDAVLLSPKTSEMIKAGQSFKLTPASQDLLRDQVDFRALEFQTTIKK